MPAASLADDAPLYDRPLRRARPTSRPAGPTTRRRLAAPADRGGRPARRCSPTPSWVYRQYDHQLFLNTVVGPGGDAAVLRLAAPGLPASARRGLALSTDSQPPLVRRRPAGRHRA